MLVRELMETIWRAGVSSVRGDVAVARALSSEPPDAFTHVLAAGKAAPAMARAALEHCPDVASCLIITKHGHGEAWADIDDRVTVIEAGHPVPDAASLEAGRAAIAFVASAGPGSRLLMLVSGGASALVEDLPNGMTLDDLKERTRAMLAEGLDIHAINARRKEISNVKDGKLAARFPGERLLTLILSDVQGDDPDVVASGLGSVPATMAHANAAMHVIASNAVARMACEEAAEEAGLETIVNSEVLYGGYQSVAAACAETVRMGAPGLYIFGGEPTVVLPEAPGEGGRNQALAVAMARELSGMEGVAVLCAGTDGTDGPTGAAGGFVTGESWNKVPDGDAALAAADSGSWLRRAQGLFVTGPTGTNVMDLMLVLKE